MGAKAADHRFHGNGMMNLNSVAAARLLMPQANGHSSSPNSGMKFPKECNTQKRGFYNLKPTGKLVIVYFFFES